MQQIEEIIKRGMYRYCCASISGRGIHYALKAVKKWLRKHLLTVEKTQKLKQIISAESKKNLTGFFLHDKHA